MSNLSSRFLEARAGRTIKRAFIGHLEPATCLTMASISLSVLAAVLVARGSLALGVMSFMYAGLCDLFDGFIARRSTRTQHQQEFGLQIDSIADMAAFGVVPVILCVQLGLTSALEVAAMIFYVCCAAMRLAYFNVHGTTGSGNRQFYTGLPVTYAALVFPILLLFATTPERPPASWLIQTYFWILGILFVLRVRIAKPGGVAYLVFPLIAIVLSGFWALRL